MCEFLVLKNFCAIFDKFSSGFLANPSSYNTCFPPSLYLSTHAHTHTHKISTQYDDDETLLAINAAINKVNAAALRDIQGSIRSYTFSDAELAAAQDGSLDVVTGFMVLDDEQRLVVLEGLAAPDKGMQSVFLDIPRTRANDNNLKILASPECLFSARLYGTFGPDLKRVRVRDRLKRLARRPELYNRRQVEEVCFSAVDAVMALRRAPTLRATKELDLYPSAEALSKVELLYGEAVSRADLDGTASEAQRAALRKESRRRKAQEAADHAAYCDALYGPSAASAAAAKTPKHSQSLSQPSSAHTHTHAHLGTADAYPQVFDREHPRCAPTDSRNADFEAHLLTRPAHRVDYLAEQRELLRQAYENALHRTAARDELSHEILVKVLGREAVEAAGSAGPKIYCYASQAENFKVKAFSELRQRIAKFTDGATYTFSKDFISQTVCTVDEDADRKAILAEKRSHWLTQTGFTYPKPKVRTQTSTQTSHTFFHTNFFSLNIHQIPPHRISTLVWKKLSSPLTQIHPTSAPFPPYPPHKIQIPPYIIHHT